jgi:hypothetical protein
MSDMLEQAIIDAEALKEAATKNAETLVLEKFSNQIREAVDSLLEQDDLGADMSAALGDLDGPVSMGPADPSAATTPALEAPVEKSSVLENIPLAVTSKDDEQIEIPLDKLTEELAALNESFRFGGDSHNISDLFEHNLAELDETDLEEVLQEEEEEEEEGHTDEPKTLTSEDLDEELDEEVDLDEDLIERLVVDLAGSNKSGWAGTPQSLVELAEEELLALEQDSEVREERAAMRKAVEKLQSVNEGLTSENDKLETTLNEAREQILKSRDIILVLKEKLEEHSLTNVKLIYQNKALSSDSLNERQKNKLVDAVSNAETIEEAKVIFETLESTVGSTSRKSRPKSLSEAVEKSSSMILAARRKNSTSQNNSPTLDRWKFLAGIDK